MRDLQEGQLANDGVVVEDPGRNRGERQIEHTDGVRLPREATTGDGDDRVRLVRRGHVAQMSPVWLNLVDVDIPARCSKISIGFARPVDGYWEQPVLTDDLCIDGHSTQTGHNQSQEKELHLEEGVHNPAN